MKETIKIIEAKLKSLEWDMNYHHKKLHDAQTDYENLISELKELKQKYPDEVEVEQTQA